ncbi:MAG TPA: NAD(P)/FAD-dependent oxidoreductase [Prolixibacteraceae bacterium]|nr:NAD(P)/FAD-dependent oxidoreductase [Prolixibacteraceae bacterium]
MNYDIIIIGAGLGGLTAGAKLAKNGKKILLLEQHDRPGGCATTFKRKDFTFEVGLHEMDGPHSKDLKVRIFKDLGLDQKVTLLDVPEFYRFVNERFDVVVPHNPEEAQNLLISLFPEDEQGIKTYFYYLLNYRKVLPQLTENPNKSLGEFLDEHIKNEDLKLILLGNLGYFHDNPYTISLNYYLVAQGSYYGGNASFVKGGSQKLSDALVEVIEENGGTVLLNHLVNEILFENDLPVGVCYQKANGKTKERIEAFAPEVVVNASLPLLANNLLPQHYGSKLAESIADIKIGASLLTVYFGFKKPLKEIGNKHYSVFLFDPSIKTQRDIVTNNHSGFDTRGFTLVDYSQVDSALAPNGKSVGAVCCIDYLCDWETLDRKSYLLKKNEVAKAITARCEKLLPGFTDALEYVEVGTPLTVKRYTLNPEGAVYGFAQNPGKTADYLKALPENVYVASAWGKFGGGFSGAIFSGYMTAMDIIRKR